MVKLSLFVGRINKKKKKTKEKNYMNEQEVNCFKRLHKYIECKAEKFRYVHFCKLAVLFIFGIVHHSAFRSRMTKS